MKMVAAAIEFGTSKVVTLLAESGNLTQRCEIIGSGTVPYAGYMDHEWNEPENLLSTIEQSIRAAESEAKRRIRDIYVGVPCEYIHVCSAVGEVDILSEDGRVTDADIDNVEDAAAEALKLDEKGGNVLHRNPAWFIVDGGKKIMQPGGTRGARLKAEVSFILADPGFIEDVRGCLGTLGVSVNAFLAPSIGTAILLMNHEERDRSPVLLDVGYLNTEVSVIEGDAIVYHAVLPMGAGRITAALAETLEIAFSQAEQIKRDFVFIPDEFDFQRDPEVQMEDGSVVTFQRDLVKQVVEGELDELVDMLRATLEDAGDKVPAHSQIYLTGGGLVNMRGGREYLAEKTGRAVKIPVARAASRLNNPRYASALGLMDMVFDVAEQQSVMDGGGKGPLNSLKNIFRR